MRERHHVTEFMWKVFFFKLGEMNGERREREGRKYLSLGGVAEEKRERERGRGREKEEKKGRGGKREGDIREEGERERERKRGVGKWARTTF